MDAILSSFTVDYAFNDYIVEQFVAKNICRINKEKTQLIVFFIIYDQIYSGYHILV